MSKILSPAEPSDADLFADLTTPIATEVTNVGDKKVSLPKKLSSTTETSSVRRHVHALTSRASIEVMTGVSHQ